MLWTRARFAEATLQRSIPTARDGMTVERFLQQIGRKCDEFVPKFPTWQDLMAADAARLKELGVDPKRRKYILRWTHFYRQGIEPWTETLPVKEHRGPKWRY